MDKYARLMQKLEIINADFFKGICQLFGIFYHFIFETFVWDSSQMGKFPPDFLTPRLKSSLSKIVQDCDQWIRPQNQQFSLSLSPTSFSSPLSNTDIMPTSPAGNVPQYFFFWTE
ncbi:hypothetical protein HPP92_022568, partial [Vanilla planifolia]